jgi:hypothetical protein
MGYDAPKTKDPNDNNKTPLLEENKIIFSLESLNELSDSEKDRLVSDSCRPIVARPWASVTRNVQNSCRIVDVSAGTILPTEREAADAFPLDADLFGVRVDGTDGPKRSMRPVARRKPEGSYVPVETMSDIITEEITAKNEREANYAHHGWSLVATAAIPPWTSSRMTNNNLKPLNREELWITKRFMLRRLAFELLVEDLEPVPEFEADVKNALAKSSNYEKFHAFYRVLHIW